MTELQARILAKTVRGLRGRYLYNPADARAADLKAIEKLRGILAKAGYVAEELADPLPRKRNSPVVSELFEATAYRRKAQS